MCIAELEGTGTLSPPGTERECVSSSGIHLQAKSHFFYRPFTSAPCVLGTWGEGRVVGNRDGPPRDPIPAAFWVSSASKARFAQRDVNHRGWASLKTSRETWPRLPGFDVIYLG